MNTFNLTLFTDSVGFSFVSPFIAPPSLFLSRHEEYLKFYQFPIKFRKGHKTYFGKAAAAAIAVLVAHLLLIIVSVVKACLVYYGYPAPCGPVAPIIIQLQAAPPAAAADKGAVAPSNKYAVPMSPPAYGATDGLPELEAPADPPAPTSYPSTSRSSPRRPRPRR